MSEELEPTIKRVPEFTVECLANGHTKEFFYNAFRTMSVVAATDPRSKKVFECYVVALRPHPKDNTKWLATMRPTGAPLR